MVRSKCNQKGVIMIENKNIGGLYKPLSDEQIETIHNAALTILEDVGITYTPDQSDLIKELESAGARIKRDQSRIRFDRKLIKQALSHAPNRLVLYSRNGKNDLDLHGDRVHFGTGGTTTTILDIETGQCRPSSLNDLFQIARLVERLSNIDLFIRPCTPMELPEDAYDVNICYAALKGTRKHVIKKVGPGGSFLETDQTFAFMRSEYYLGNGMTDRDSRDKWIEAGSKDAAERAREMVKQMLSETDETTIPDEVDRAIRQKYLIHMKS